MELRKGLLCDGLMLIKCIGVAAGALAYSSSSGTPYSRRMAWIFSLWPAIHRSNVSFHSFSPKRTPVAFRPA